MEKNNYWVNSGRSPKIFGFISGRTFILFLLTIFAFIFIWPFLASLIVDFLEYKFKMSSFELARSLWIRFGLLFGYKKSRELGRSIRVKSMTYYYGDANFKRPILGFMAPFTFLFIFILAISGIVMYLTGTLEYNIFSGLRRFTRVIFFISFVTSFILVLKDLVKYFATRKTND